MPIEVPLSCIATGCRPGGTVLDMFAGTAVTGLAARALGRSFIGVEETQALCRIAAQRLRLDLGNGYGQ
jgi:site-specific DNA-methyltransferase (cytosine-N4-specific)